MRHIPRKRFGQHFLHDPVVLDRIIDAIRPRAGEQIIEIGPGEGALTARLLEHVPHLTAIEIDRDLAAYLRHTLTAAQLTLHEADALRFDYASLGQDLRIVGNLPYNVSTPLLFVLAEVASQVKDMHFMLQREVVDRMAAAPDTEAYGRLSVALQRRFRVERLFRVAPGSFRPPPKVESAIVRLIPRPHDQLVAVDDALFQRIITQAFSARRKTLRNALAGLITERGLEDLQLGADRRPDTLSPEEYLRVAQYLQTQTPTDQKN